MKRILLSNVFMIDGYAEAADKVIYARHHKITLF